MSEWEYKILGSVAKVKGRIGWKGYKTSDLRDFGPIVFSGTEIKSQTFIDFSKVKHLTTEKYEESPEIILKDKDIMVATRGSLGQIGFYRKEYGPATINPSLVIVSDFEGIPEFLFYYFISNLGQENILAQASGTTIPAIYQADLKKIKIPYPPVATQTAIAEILSSLDDKIELNNKINQELENLAQTLFKQWFIDFEFPNEKGEPYKSSGGEMVESELGEIPKGWEVKRLKQLLTVKRGGSPRPIHDFMAESGLPWVKISDATALNSPFLFSTKEFIKVEGLRKTVLLKKGSLILSNSATPGLPKFLELDACIHDGWLHFEDIQQLTFNYLYLLFISIRLDLVGQGNGSIFINLKTDILKEYAITVPNADVINNFSNIIDPIFDKIKNVSSEIIQLTNLRDTLLPKLISGELEVSQIQTTA